MIFYRYMETNSDSSSNDKIPSFFLKDGKNTEDLYQGKSNENNQTESASKTPRRSSKLTIHWPSLGIGAIIAIACIFFGVLMTNMINIESTQNLDQILIKEINPTKKP